jgi:hypothetical protein
MAKTNRNHHGLNRPLGPNYPAEVEVRENDRWPEVQKTVVRGADASVDIKKAGLNNPQPGTVGVRDRVKNPQGRRIT